MHEEAVSNDMQSMKRGDSETPDSECKTTEVGREGKERKRDMERAGGRGDIRVYQPNS